MNNKLTNFVNDETNNRGEKNNKKKSWIIIKEKIPLKKKFLQRFKIENTVNTNTIKTLLFFFILFAFLSK